MHQFWTKHITYFNFLLNKFLIVYKTRLKILSIFSEPWCFFSCEYFFQLIIPNQVVKCCLYCSICPFNKMNCELMLTYDTPAPRQTGSRNLTGQKTLPTIWGVHFTEYSNIFPKIVVTGLYSKHYIKIEFFPSVFYINYLSLTENGILDDIQCYFI
jgi:hypothetical protein